MPERMPEDEITSMPIRLNELVVLMRCLKNGFESERICETDKEVVRRLMHRIDLFAERQGAWWDKIG